jgi:signal transduction histidine kinase
MLAVELPAEVPHVTADHEALRRVVCSLIENAIKYTPEGGRITVAARASNETDEVEITVKDNGCGILPEDLALVFEKFYRGRPAATSPGGYDREEPPSGFVEAPGVGLGLYLARSIVSQLGGSISVESPPKNETTGTAFTVRMPLWRDEGGGGVIEEQENVEAVARG